MTKYRKTLAVVAAAAMGVTGLAACGGGGGDGDAGHGQRSAVCVGLLVGV